MSEKQAETARNAINGSDDNTATATEPAPESGDGEGEPKEVGGREGPDPTRYGDWEKAGRCIDF